MARAKSGKSSAGEDIGISLSPPSNAGSSIRPVTAKLHELARRRARVLVILAVVATIGFVLRSVWQRVAPRVAASERYLVPASGITVSPPPEWIVADVRQQVIHKAGLDRRLSILDPAFVDQIQHAFTLHPWVEQVVRIEKKSGPGVFVELAYRRPVATIEAPLGDSHELLPVDNAGRHLPAEDVPLIRRQYLPRIIGISGRPPVGQNWEDRRVPGAVEIAVRLGAVWEQLHLFQIVPSAREEVRDDRQYFVYEVVTRGGTKIIWGAAPRDQVPGEAAFALKLDRLRQCVERYGPLDTVKAPDTINVRGELQVTPRMVKQPKNGEEPATVVK